MEVEGMDNNDCGNKHIEHPDKSQEQNLKKDLHIQDDEVFQSNSRFENDRYLIPELGEQITLDEFQYENNRKGIFGNIPSTNKTQFFPGEDFIPVYSSDHRNVFSFLSRGEGSSDIQGAGSIYHSCWTHTKSMNETIIPPTIKLNSPVETITVEGDYSAPKVTPSPTEKDSKKLPPDFLYRWVSTKTDDESKVPPLIPEMISKAVFDKLARELVKVKRDNVELRNQNHKLHLRQEELQQKVEESRNKMCEMNVELPDPSSAKMTLDSTNRSIGDLYGQSTEYHDPHTQEKRNDIEIGLNRENERLKRQYEAFQIQYHEDLKRQRNVQESLENKLKQAENSVKKEKQRCGEIESMLFDERDRWARDVNCLKKKIESLKDKLKGQESGLDVSMKKRCSSNSSNREGRNLMTPSRKDQYIKQGAIPKE